MECRVIGYVIGQLKFTNEVECRTPRCEEQVLAKKQCGDQMISAQITTRTESSGQTIPNCLSLTQTGRSGDSSVTQLTFL